MISQVALKIFMNKISDGMKSLSVESPPSMALTFPGHMSPYHLQLLIFLWTYLSPLRGLIL
jgi:hypothetical protein